MIDEKGIHSILSVQKRQQDVFLNIFILLDQTRKLMALVSHQELWQVELAQTHPKEADVVVGVPIWKCRCPWVCIESGIPWYGFVKNSYVEEPLLNPSNQPVLPVLELS